MRIFEPEELEATGCHFCDSLRQWALVKHLILDHDHDGSNAAANGEYFTERVALHLQGKKLIFDTKTIQEMESDPDWELIQGKALAAVLSR